MRGVRTKGDLGVTPRTAGGVTDSRKPSTIREHRHALTVNSHIPSGSDRV